MLEQDTKIAKTKKSFTENAGEYFVNMGNMIRTLHKKDNPSCQYSHHAYQYISFESLKDVEKYEKAHKDATPFRRCGNCFKTR